MQSGFLVQHDVVRYVFVGELGSPQIENYATINACPFNLKANGDII